LLSTLNYLHDFVKYVDVTFVPFSLLVVIHLPLISVGFSFAREI